MIIRFHVDGQPVPKQSFRVISDGRSKIHGFQPRRVRAWQNAVGWVAKEAAVQNQLMGPTTADVITVLTFTLADNRRVDLDNLSKAVLDAINGIIWVDDRQVCDLRSIKRVGSPPGVDVYIESEK